MTILSKASVVALAASSMFFTAPAQAATVTFSNVTGTWLNGVLSNGTAPTYSGNGTAVAQARWGGDAGFGQSGYNFGALAIAPLTVSPPAGSASTQIATFDHVNFPVFAPSLVTMTLLFSADVDVDGTPLGSRTFTYNFVHDETTNNLDPCPYGGANGQGLNINGCADRVSVNFNSQSDFFVIGSENYTLDIVGFLVNNQPTTSFTTVERQVNSGFILGRLVLFSEAAAIPEPATWALLIGGFGLTGGAPRRRRAIAA